MLSLPCNHEAELVELRGFILELRAELALLRAENEQLRSENAKLRTENAELKAHLNQNSSNSSKPPSSDGPGSPPRLASKPTGKTRGGQVGQKRVARAVLAPDEVVDFIPSRCGKCAGVLVGRDDDAASWQVFELPKVVPHVTEYRSHALSCGGCGAVTREPIPASIRAHGFGPRAAAFVAYATGSCRLSKRQVRELCRDVFGLPVSLGSVCGLERTVSASLSAPVLAAAAAMQQQSVVHMDETSWRMSSKRAWLWMATSRLATVFRVAASRGAVVAKEMLGVGFRGHLVTDRWGAYNWVDLARRQLCWSHLIRDLLGMVERRGVGRTCARVILALMKSAFKAWHRLRNSEISRAAFQELVAPLRAKVEAQLALIADSEKSRSSGMAKRLLKQKAALWTFVDKEGIEPTNNIAERRIRPAVIWRKNCFGNDSEEGAQYTERILTTVATTRQHGKSAFDYLSDACTAFRQGIDVPSLLTLAPAG